MRNLSEMKRDQRGGAGAKFLLIAALVAMPVLYPTKTGNVLRSAQSGWEQVWTIDGLAGKGA
ncbi:MAG TPA: hypothetical protein VGO55_15605 [Allosphingosinicella sp.]|jgi:hypothetical protein|nr:hypothetical protein [Allosphingosinicella sp.]